MTKDELNKLIEKESEGAFKTIENLKSASNTKENQKIRKRIRMLMDKDRKKRHEEGSKLSFDQRYNKIIIDGKNYLEDMVTGERHSEKRMLKKELKNSLLRPSGRQLKKEIKYLRWLKNESAKIG